MGSIEPIEPILTLPLATEYSKVELRILHFKIIWSEFQKPGQTAATGGEAKLHRF